MRNGEAMLSLAFVTAWICGIAITAGFWMTLACVVFPPLAWVVLAKHLMGVAS